MGVGVECSLLILVRESACVLRDRWDVHVAYREPSSEATSPKAAALRHTRPALALRYRDPDRRCDLDRGAPCRSAESLRPRPRGARDLLGHRDQQRTGHRPDLAGPAAPREQSSHGSRWQPGVRCDPGLVILHGVRWRFRAFRVRRRRRVVRRWRGPRGMVSRGEPAPRGGAKFPIPPRTRSVEWQKRGRDRTVNASDAYDADRARSLHSTSGG